MRKDNANMVKASDTIVVEVAGPQNENLWFLPLDRRIRGRFDATKIPEASGALMKRFPQGIPGQRLGLDTKTATGWIDEPLRDPEHAATRKEVEKLGAIPEREDFSSVDVPTWAHHIRGAVQSGKARVVEGQLPEVGGVPVVSLVGSQPVDPIKELTAAIREQTALLAKLVEPR